MRLHLLLKFLQLIPPVGHRCFQPLAWNAGGSAAAWTMCIIVSQILRVNFLQSIEHGDAAECVGGLAKSTTDVHGYCTPWKSGFATENSEKETLSQSSLWRKSFYRTLLREGLYTDFHTRAQFLFVLVERLMNVHTCILIEPQCAGQVLGIHAQTHF